VRAGGGRHAVHLHVGVSGFLFIGGCILERVKSFCLFIDAMYLYIDSLLNGGWGCIIGGGILDGMFWLLWSLTTTFNDMMRLFFWLHDHDITRWMETASSETRIFACGGPPEVFPFQPRCLRGMRRRRVGFVAQPVV
jgi:hypothetical protein